MDQPVRLYREKEPERIARPAPPVPEGGHVVTKGMMQQSCV
jgi:hypothetical protein